jgi:curved DNA-binding protein CbpA
MNNEKMNLTDALNILHIDNLATIDLQSLKKRYHKLALQHHPDKNGNTIESKEHFQMIGEAHDLLKRELGELGVNELDENDNDQENESGYTFILTMFLKTLFKDVNYEIVLSILKDAVSVALFESINKEMCIHIYDFIIKYKNVLHISDEILEKVKRIILEKYKDVQIYILNPSLFDLFENNIYKLKVEDVIYYVPLWHNEIAFQKERKEDTNTINENNSSKDSKDSKNSKDNKNSKDSEIIVKCIPELPDNVEIDENNNLIISITIPLTLSLFFEKKYLVYIEKYMFEIPMVKLSCIIDQIYVLKGQGISQILEKDVFDISKKSDLIFRIKFI